MVIVDNYTGATMYIPTEGQTAAIVIYCLMQHWVPIHGLPKTVITDNGKGFASLLNQEIYKLLGIHKLFTSRYHPQTNGKAERMVQELKKHLRVLKIELDNDLVNVSNTQDTTRAIEQIKLLLPSIQFAVNQRHRNFCQTSPHQMIYGTNLREIPDLPKSLQQLESLEQSNDIKMAKQTKIEIIDKLRKQIKAMHNQYDIKHSKYVLIMKQNFDQNKTDPTLQINDYVAYYVGDRANTSRKLRRRFTGPWKIINKLNNNTYQILNEDTNETMACHVQMLKRYNKQEFTPLATYEQTENNRRKLDKLNKNSQVKQNRQQPRDKKKLENQITNIIIDN